jgi:hypothetical protein
MTVSLGHPLDLSSLPEFDPRDVTIDDEEILADLWYPYGEHATREHRRAAPLWERTLDDAVDARARHHADQPQPGTS